MSDDEHSIDVAEETALDTADDEANDEESFQSE
jgi:hypothetical protein